MPISSSDEFAALLPRWVTYFRVPAAGHTEEWNVDPALYERRVDAFLGRVSRNRRAPVRPGSLGLELGGEGEQGRLVARAANDLHR